MADIYLSSSWKMRIKVREYAERLRMLGYSVYDFTDSNCRTTPEMPPENFPLLFDPEKHNYEEYLRAGNWKAGVDCNRQAIENCQLILLLLPCGLDAHADAFYGLGLGKKLIVVGHPVAGERVPTHMWADGFARDIHDVLDMIPDLT